MTVTYLAGGGSMAFAKPSSGNVFESTLAGTFDPGTTAAPISRCSIQIGANGDTTSFAEWDFASTTTTPNVGFMAYGAEPGDAAEHVWLRILDSTNTSGIALTIIRKDGTGSGDVTVRLYKGADTTFTAQCTTNMKTLQKVDIAATYSASGSIQVYFSKTLAIDTGTIDTSAISAANKVRIYAVSGINYVSEMICSTASTVRLRGYTRWPTGEGPDTGGTGAYTDVDEVVYSDVDGISFASAGLIHTLAGNSTTLGGFAVEAVLVGARAALGTTGPTKLDLAIRSASDNLNHFSTDVALTAGYAPAVGIWQTDPGSLVTWTNANASTSKFGGKSIA